MCSLSLMSIKWFVRQKREIRSEKVSITNPVISHEGMVCIKSLFHLSPPRSHSPEFQLSSVTYNWSEVIESHFSQGFEMSLLSWSGSNRSHMQWVRRKAILKQKNPSLGLMTLGSFSHLSVFILETVWGCMSYFLLDVTKLWGRKPCFIHRRDGISDKQMVMSEAIKFSSRGPVRWFVVDWFAFPFVILNYFWVPSTVRHTSDEMKNHMKEFDLNWVFCGHWKTSWS